MSHFGISCTRGHAEFVGERTRREKEKEEGKNLCVEERRRDIRAYVRTRE